MLWLGLILLVIVAGYWALTLVLDLALWIAILVTTLAVLVFLGAIAFVRLRAARRAAALEQELLRQAERQADRAQPNRRADILALQQQMKAAIASLKQSKLGAKGGKAALYALPWYVITGPPAAGKTTALERSGLSFAGGAKGGAKVRGTAGTRNCDWWFSRDAILLDTAGRFATEDEDREEWQAFLDTVRRFRPERPVDGLVVAVSLAELATLEDAQLEELAHKLRERVDEVMTRLEMVLPIYVMFTKADLIGGFVEFFSDYTKVQRAQAWGATFAVDDARLEEPAKAFEAEFDELLQVLHARMLERLAREQLPEVRAKVLQFPLEFQSLRAPLARFIDELCRNDPYADTPIVRGFYFCSGTQTGKPLERVLANMVRGFDLRLGSATQQTTREPQSYFVTQLFEKIIFPDRELAVRSSSKVRRQSRKQLIVAAAAVLGMLLVLIPGMVSYARSSDLIGETTSDVEQARRLEASREPGAGLAALDVLHRRVSLLDDANERTRIPGLWGLRTAPELLPPVEALYVSRLRREIEQPVREQLVGAVRAIENVQTDDATAFWDAYDSLKLYLMLGNPEQRLDPTWAAPKLAEVWSRLTRGDAKREALEVHAGFYLAKMKNEPTWAWELDGEAVGRAQATLNAVPLDKIISGWLAAKAQGVPPIRADRFFYGEAAQYVTVQENTEVPGLYTKKGWEKVRPALASPMGLELASWVLGRESSLEEKEKPFAEVLLEHYFAEYGKTWSTFLSRLRVAAPRDRKSAIQELRVLSESAGPYVRLFTGLRDNVTLEMPPKSLRERIKAKGEEVILDAGPPPREVSPVEASFKPMLSFAFGDGAEGGPPPRLTQYLTQLTLLESALSQGSEASYGAETERARVSVQALFGGLDVSTRKIVEGLLMPPVRVVVEDPTGPTINTAWKDVWSFWNDTLAPRFPFANVAVDVSVDEFSEFFGPQGLLWSFFDEQLKDHLASSGRGFAPKPGGSRLAFRKDFQQCLSHAQDITRAVFGKAPEPLVPFSVNVLPAGDKISEISLVIDGKAIVYKNEPERWQPARWPGNGEPRGGTLRVRGARFTDQIPREGQFGFFRLLSEGAVKPMGASKPGVLVGTWNLGRRDTSVTIEYKPTKSIHPFSPDFFGRMKCPPVAIGG